MNFENRESAKPKDESRIIDENTYIDMSVDYALMTGWVKPEKKHILIDNYLKPIYQKYTEVINEVTTEVAAEADAEILLKTIIKRLNQILEPTRRIGSTEDNNITRSIYDYRDRLCQSNTYLEYAATSLADFIRDLLYSKS